MVFGAVLNLVGEAMVEFRESLLKTAPPKLMKELIKTIIPPKGVKTAKPSKYDAPEDEGMKYGMSMIMKIQNRFRCRVFGEEGNGIDTTVNPEDETV